MCALHLENQLQSRWTFSSLPAAGDQNQRTKVTKMAKRKKRTAGARPLEEDRLHSIIQLYS